MFELAENETEDSTDRNKNYHLGEVEKEAFGVFLITRREPIELLVVVVPPRECNDPEVVEAMEVNLDKQRKFEAYNIMEDEGQEQIDGILVVNTRDEPDRMKVQVKVRYSLRGLKDVKNLLDPKDLEKGTISKLL